MGRSPEAPAARLLVASLAALEQAGEPAAVLRDANGSGPVHEVDVLVRGGGRRLVDPLRRLGFVPLRAWGHDGHRFFVARLPDGDLLKLDCVRAVGGIDVRDALERRRSAGGVPRLDPAADAAALMLHCLADLRGVPVRHRVSLRAYADAPPPAPAGAPAGLRRLWPQLWSAAGASDWKRIEALAPRAAAACPHPGPLRRWLRRQARRAYFARVRLRGPRQGRAPDAVPDHERATELERALELAEDALASVDGRVALAAGRPGSEFRIEVVAAPAACAEAAAALEHAGALPLGGVLGRLQDRGGTRLALLEGGRVLAGAAVAPAGGARPARLRRRRGVRVAFSGIDGAGKSTQASLLAAALERLGIPCRAAWTRLGYGGPGLRMLARAGQRLLPAGSHSAMVARAAGAPAGAHATRRGVLGWTWALAVTLGYLWRLAWRSRPPRGGVVILDRALTDALVELETGYGGAVGLGLHERLLRMLAPSPHAVFHLRLSAPEALRRKPDMFAPSVLARQAAAYELELLSSNGVVVQLDATRPPEELHAQVLRSLAGMDRRP